MHNSENAKIGSNLAVQNRNNLLLVVTSLQLERVLAIGAVVTLSVKSLGAHCNNSQNSSSRANFEIMLRIVNNTVSNRAGERNIQIFGLWVYPIQRL